MLSIENIVSFFSLLIINIAMLYFSNRKRKYGIFSTILLYVLFFSFWGYILYSFQLNSRQIVINATPGQQVYKVVPKSLQGVYNLNNQAFIDKQNKVLKEKAEKEATLKAHLSNAWLVLRLCEIQAFLALLFAIFGRFNINGRNPYYNRLIIAHTLMLAFCVFADISESIFGILG